MFDNVGQSLDTLGLGRYAGNFAEHEVGLELLPELGDADLKEMGISALGHRKTCSNRGREQRFSPQPARARRGAGVDSLVQRRRDIVLFKVLP